MRELLLASAIALAAVPAAKAGNVTWSFGNGGAGDIGQTTTQMPDPGSVITTMGVGVTGFGPLGALTPVDLFRKELTGDEFGMGLANDPTLNGGVSEHEIHVGSGFIQLDLNQLTIPPLTSLSLSFGMDSTTAPDAWQVVGTNIAGANLGTTLKTGTDEATYMINAAGFRYLDVSATTGNVLLRELDANVAVPEPASLALLGAGLAGLGFVRRRRHRSV